MPMSMPFTVQYSRHVPNVVNVTHRCLLFELMPNEPKHLCAPYQLYQAPICELYVPYPAEVACHYMWPDLFTFTLRRIDLPELWTTQFITLLWRCGTFSCLWMLLWGFFQVAFGTHNNYFDAITLIMYSTIMFTDLNNNF